MPKLLAPAIDAAATKVLVQCLNTAVHAESPCPPLPDSLIDRTVVAVSLDAHHTLINRQNQAAPTGVAVLSRAAARLSQPIPEVEHACAFVKRFRHEDTWSGVERRVLDVEYPSNFAQQRYRDGDVGSKHVVVPMGELASALQSFSGRSHVDPCQLHMNGACEGRRHRHDLVSCEQTMQRVADAVLAVCPRDTQRAITDAAVRAWQAECPELRFDSFCVDVGQMAARAVLRTGTINHAKYEVTLFIPCRIRAC